MNEETLLQIAKAEIANKIVLAEDYFNQTFELPMLNLKQRGKIAGSAHLQKNLIKLNLSLFEDNIEEFIQQVISVIWKGKTARERMASSHALSVSTASERHSSVRR
jgi:hypothetical protein